MNQFTLNSLFRSLKNFDIKNIIKWKYNYLKIFLNKLFY